MAVTPVSPTAGQTIDKTFWDAQVYQQFVDLYSAWTAFTPTWSGASANPTLGNGILEAAYKQLGKTVHVRIRIQVGSTTNMNTSGLWGFTLPASATPTTNQSLSGFCSNSAGTVRHAVAAYLTSGSGVFRVAANGNSGVSHNQPFVWATGDHFVLTGTYECT